jgi:hypothetical protein
LEASEVATSVSAPTEDHCSGPSGHPILEKPFDTAGVEYQLGRLQLVKEHINEGAYLTDLTMEPGEICALERARSLSKRRY